MKLWDALRPHMRFLLLVGYAAAIAGVILDDEHLALGGLLCWILDGLAVINKKLDRREP